MYILTQSESGQTGALSPAVKLANEMIEYLIKRIYKYSWIVAQRISVNKIFTQEVTWSVSQIDIRRKFIQEKWNGLSSYAIIIGFKPFLFEHSDITKSSTIISVSAYKSPPWFVSLLYFLSHRGSYSFLPRWRRGMK